MNRILLCSLALLTLTVANAQAAIYYVATTGNDGNAGTQSQPFRTIAKGIAVAADGDAVTLANGTYNEQNLDFGAKNLTLKSSSGNPANCILDCQQLGQGIAIAGGQTAVAVQGLTIRNALTTSNHTGAAMVVSSSNVLVSNCVFSSCRFNYSAGGLGADTVYLDLGAQATIEGCTFSGNGGGNSSGALVSPSGNLTMRNCILSGNSSGALGVLGGIGRLTGCTLSGNSNQNGGAGLYLAGGTVAMDRCAITGNRSNNNEGNYFGGGGGAWVTGGGLTLDSCLVIGNSSATTSGSSGNPRLNSQIFLESLRNALAVVVVNCTFVVSDTGTNGRTNILISCPTFSDGRKNAIVANSILRGSNGFGDVAADPSQYSIANSNLTGSADPKFVNPAVGNYRLQSSSPCIDAGSASAPGLPSTELDGGPRILGSAPDMGAYEFWTASYGQWFVDTTLGNDATGTGSPTAPFQTVVKAISTANNGQKLYIKQGTYSTDKPRITKKLQLFNWLDTGAARVGKS